jgi:DNA-binding CsgD family transcriptional regulator
MGELDKARERIAMGHAAGSDAPDHAFLLEAEARLRLAEGDPAGALHSARAAGEHVEGRYGAPRQPRVFEWRRLAAAAAHELGDDALAAELLAPDLDSLRATGPRRQLGAALTVAGLVTRGREGLALLSEAAAVLERSPARLQRAETLLTLGAALRRSGERKAAEQRLYAALELAAETGAALLERRARDELVRLGLRPRRATRTGAASLTPSERRVAELAAEGLTTPQIAQRLYITANTVETHLAHVYRKLGLRGRRQLAQALPEVEEHV